jgi:hypothetical protein
MQQVLDRWQRTGTRRVEPDLLRHIGPMHFQNINFRGEMAFPLARYRSRLILGLSAKTGHETHGSDGSLGHQVIDSLGPITFALF